MAANISEHQGALCGLAGDRTPHNVKHTIGQVMQSCRELAVQMVEAKDMCEHVLERLQAIADEVDKLPSRPTLHAITRYMEILKSYHGFLEHNASKRAVMRLIHNRVIVSENRQVHTTIDKLIGGLNIPEDSTVLQGWRERFEGFQRAQQSAFEAMSKNRVRLRDNMPDAQTQSEALSLLLFEFKKMAHVGYTEAELKILHDAFAQVAQFSKNKVSAVETWFLPPYEISYEETPFAWGAFGTVHHAKYLGSEAVVKRVQIASEHERAMFVKEANAWFDSSRHPNVVKLFGAYHVGTQPFFVCEYAANGNLADYLYRDENRCRTWKMLYEAGLGLKYLHQKKNLIHNDMKCNNIVVSGDHVAMIADFGLCSISTSARTSSIQSPVGALSWKAPEIVGNTSKPTFASDIYSFAMCIIEAVSHRSPWEGTNIVAVHREVAAGVLPPRPENLTDEQWKLVVEMSTFKPEDRLEIGAVVEKLKKFADDEFNSIPTDEQKRASIIEYFEQNRDQQQSTESVPSIALDIGRPMNLSMIEEDEQPHVDDEEEPRVSTLMSAAITANRTISGFVEYKFELTLSDGTTQNCWKRFRTIREYRNQLMKTLKSGIVSTIPTFPHRRLIRKTSHRTIAYRQARMNDFFSALMKSESIPVGIKTADDAVVFKAGSIPSVILGI
ncbi:Tkl protein kinase, partial [Globisporangium splendens]